MPEVYLKIRDKMRKIMPLKAAKTKAAKIFNANRKPGTAPVTSKHKLTKRPRKTRATQPSF